MSSIPQSKTELVSAINTIFPKLIADYELIDESRARIQELEGNVKGSKISVADTVAYLIGWGQLVLKWFNRKSQGLPVDFPETGYNWTQLGLLAVSFHRQYNNWAYCDLLTELKSTTEKIVDLITKLSNKELYESPWYEKWTLGRMIQLNTCSPMKSIRTKVRRFNKTYLPKNA